LWIVGHNPIHYSSNQEAQDQTNQSNESIAPKTNILIHPNLTQLIPKEPTWPQIASKFSSSKQDQNLQQYLFLNKSNQKIFWLTCLSTLIQIFEMDISSNHKFNVPKLQNIGLLVLLKGKLLSFNIFRKKTFMSYSLSIYTIFWKMDWIHTKTIYQKTIYQK